jgi:transcription elongation factor GreB
LEAELAQLSSRVASARVVDPRVQPRDEVRSGETVSLRYRVDEAAPVEGLIAFLGARVDFVPRGPLDALYSLELSPRVRRQIKSIGLLA